MKLSNFNLKEFSKKYLEIINSEYKGINLTGIKNFEDFYQKQALDSVYPFVNIEEIDSIQENYDIIIDIGFGGGFPLLPLSLLFSRKRFLGIEAKGKKAKAVQEIAQKLELTNVKTIHGRIESFLFDSKCLMTIKAVGNVYEILKKIKATSDTTVIFYKGPKVKDLESINPPNGWKMTLFKEYSLTDTVKRSIIAYKSENVPHRTVKSLVRLSKIDLS